MGICPSEGPFTGILSAEVKLVCPKVVSVYEASGQV